MAKPSHFSLLAPNLTTLCIFLLLATTLGHASSARMLEDVDPESPVSTTDSPDSAPLTTPTTSTSASSSGQFPAASPTVAAEEDAEAPEAVDVGEPVVADMAPESSISATSASPPNTVTATTADPDPHHPQLSFFMHDILGGSHPSGRVVTGIIANTDASGVPFSKANGGMFPVNGGVPMVNRNNPVVNNNNAPFLASLNGVQSSANTVIQNGGGGNRASASGNNQPFVSAGNLPSGATLQQLMFGTITAVDNELTEGHELGAAVMGRAQGFYLVSSLDGTSHTVALTAMFHGGGDHHEEEEGSLSFFGIHRAGSLESQIAVVGGTGKYEHSKGYANIEMIRHGDEHTTDGVETILHFTVYLSD